MTAKLFLVAWLVRQPTLVVPGAAAARCPAATAAALPAIRHVTLTACTAVAASSPKTTVNALEAILQDGREGALCGITGQLSDHQLLSRGPSQGLYDHICSIKETIR